MPAKQSNNKKKTSKKTIPAPKKERNRKPNPKKASCQTLKQASATTGLPITTIKRIRDEFGATCFRSGRIYTTELMDWFAENGEKLIEGTEPVTKEEWQIVELKKKVEKLDIENAKKRGELIPVAQVIDMATLLGSEILKIHKQNETNLPPFLTMMEADQIRVAMRRVTDDVAKRMQPILEKWKASDE